MLVFVVPHQFIRGFCKTLTGKIKANAIGISLIKVLKQEKQHKLGIETNNRKIERMIQNKVYGKEVSTATLE